MMRNAIEFQVYGRMALFTDPITKIGGERSSYAVPTYQALKGITESIYWKPTIFWLIDEVRVMNRLVTQARGGRRDIFLGTRECQGYVEPVKYGEGAGYYDGAGEMPLGTMLHGFDYPDETGENALRVRFWQPEMKGGVIRFPRPEECTLVRRIREAQGKHFTLEDIRLIEDEAVEWEGGGA